MGSNTFPQFLNLPPELRHRVWDLAVRPVSAERHVHRFIIVYHHFGSREYNPRPIPGSFLRLHRHNGYRMDLAVPWDHPERGRNDSMYNLDEGMWMACRDSRAAMEKAFPKNEWWSEIKSANSPQQLAGRGNYFGQDDASHTASYVDRDGKERIITLRPDTDLIHLDALGLACVDWFYSYAADTETILDYRGHHEALPKSSFLGSNIAVDYDTVMMDIVEGRSPHRCFTKIKMHSESLIEMVNLIYDECGRTLWFIDHRLQPRSADSSGSLASENQAITNPDMDQRHELRTIFRSDEAEFIEVTREDMPNWEIQLDELSTNSKTVFEFFDALEIYAMPRLEIQDWDRLKVLASRPLSKKSHKEAPQRDPEARCPVCQPPSPVRRNRRLKHGEHLEDLDDVVSLSDLNLFD